MPQTPQRRPIQLTPVPVKVSVAGADVQGGQVTVRGQRLYSLVSLPGDEQHTLKVVVPPGVSAYDFTFG